MIGYAKIPNFMTQMRIFAVLVLLIASIPAPLAQDFESASMAYKNRNYAVAFEEFSQLAAQGDARAQAVLAIMYKYGESVPLNLEKAYEWYLKAAEQGYPPAQFHVGSMLLSGEGIAEDRDTGLDWLKSAAEAGYTRATDRLTELEGQNVIQYNDEPVAWSQQWNLRLPNEIRESDDTALDAELKVYRAQVGAMSTVTGAQRLWQQLLERHGSLLEDYQPIFRQGLSGQKTVIRLQLGPFDSQQQAARFCTDYTAATGRPGACIALLTD